MKIVNPSVVKCAILISKILSWKKSDFEIRPLRGKLWDEDPKSSNGNLWDEDPNPWMKKWDLNLKSLNRKIWDENLKSLSGNLWDEDPNPWMKKWDLNLKSLNRKIWDEDLKSLSSKLWDEDLKSLSEKNDIKISNFEISNLYGQKIEVSIYFLSLFHGRFWNRFTPCSIVFLKLSSQNFPLKDLTFLASVLLGKKGLKYEQSWVLETEDGVIWIHFFHLPKNGDFISNSLWAGWKK